MGKIFGICDVPVKTFEAVWVPYKFSAHPYEPAGKLAVKGFADNVKAVSKPKEGVIGSFVRKLLNPNSRHLWKTKHS